jgi:hypothetical protein
MLEMCTQGHISLAVRATTVSCSRTLLLARNRALRRGGRRHRRVDVAKGNSSYGVDAVRSSQFVLIAVPFLYIVPQYSLHATRLVTQRIRVQGVSGRSTSVRCRWFPTGRPTTRFSPPMAQSCNASSKSHNAIRSHTHTLRCFLHLPRLKRSTHSFMSIFRASAVFYS